MKNVEINGKKYKIIKDEKEGFNLEELSSKLTDFFDGYDYILGDWAYGKLRLKGFTKKENKNHKELNDFKKVDKYIEENCAYGCRHFIIEKIND